jgi:hypothetical protein
MRAFEPAPAAVVDDFGAPRFGSYVGAVPRVDLSALAGGPLRRVVREKRWVYFAVASADTFVACAVVRLGYAATAFAYALDARTMRLLGTRSVVAPSLAAEVAEGTSEGLLARFAFGGVSVRFERAAGSPSYLLEAKLKDFALHAVVSTEGAPPPITAIAPIGAKSLARYVNTTEKRALLTATGELEIDGRRRSLDGALAGYDYTHGLLARRTAWRWAYCLGRAKTGERVGMNLVQGFVGEPECAVWIDDDVFPLEEGRFAFDTERPLSEWRVSTADGAVDLRFQPGGMHAENKNLGVVASRFVQPCGAFRGVVRAGGRELHLADVLGVTEEQDVLW